MGGVRLGHAPSMHEVIRKLCDGSSKFTCRTQDSKPVNNIFTCLTISSSFFNIWIHIYHLYAFQRHSMLIHCIYNYWIDGFLSINLTHLELSWKESFLKLAYFILHPAHWTLLVTPSYNLSTHSSLI